MKIEFREKALIAIESMDEDAAKKIMHKIQELHTISTNNPNIRRFSNSRLNVLILKVGNIRMPSLSHLCIILISPFFNTKPPISI